MTATPTQRSHGLQKLLTGVIAPQSLDRVEDNPLAWHPEEPIEADYLQALHLKE